MAESDTCTSSIAAQKHGLYKHVPFVQRMGAHIPMFMIQSYIRALMQYKQHTACGSTIRLISFSSLNADQ